MIVDMNEWYNYIKRSGFNYSFGTKIHGSIMPILAGIPATLLTIDSRTREMAEFFDIPCHPFAEGHAYTSEELEQFCSEADYSMFNERFRGRYQAYEDFLIVHKIVNKMNTCNRFFTPDDSLDSEEFQPNRKSFAEYAKKLRVEKPLFAMAGITSKLIRLTRS